MNRIDEELIEAAKENNLPEVRRLLSDGADVNTTATFYGRTPLHWAGSHGHVQVFQALLEHGADIEAKDNGGWTPLHYACYKGHLPVVIELLSPNDSSNGTTTSILGKRKSRGGANTEAKLMDGSTPLHFACREGHLPVVKALLTGGANILAANDYGRLPVHEAVRFRRPEVTKCLLQHFYATYRRLPLHALVEDLTWIGDSYGRDAPQLHAALYQDVLDTDDVVEIVEFLADRNPAWLCSSDQNGSLPLHLACCRGASFSIIQWLVNRYGVSIKSVTRQGCLPLFLACEIPETSLDTIFLLMTQNPMCDVNVETFYRLSTLRRRTTIPRRCNNRIPIPR
jgi:hypothetical protein